MAALFAPYQRTLGWKGTRGSVWRLSSLKPQGRAFANSSPFQKWLSAPSSVASAHGAAETID